MKRKQSVKSDSDFITQKGVELLHFLDNHSPNKEQLHTIKQLIRCWVVPIHLGFNGRLTSQERSCLWYAAKGFSVNETAHIMKITVNTVKSYRKNIMKKLDCVSILEAIIKSGMIINKLK